MSVENRSSDVSVESRSSIVSVENRSTSVVSVESLLSEILTLILGFKVSYQYFLQHR